MKTIIGKGRECSMVRRKSRILKRNRIQTYQVRAAKSTNRQKLRMFEWDNLTEKVTTDYYS